MRGVIVDRALPNSHTTMEEGKLLQLTSERKKNNPAQRKSAYPLPGKRLGSSKPKSNIYCADKAMSSINAKAVASAISCTSKL